MQVQSDGLAIEKGSTVLSGWTQEICPPQLCFKFCAENTVNIIKILAAICDIKKKKLCLMESFFGYE